MVLMLVFGVSVCETGSCFLIRLVPKACEIQSQSLPLVEYFLQQGHTPKLPQTTPLTEDQILNCPRPSLTFLIQLTITATNVIKGNLLQLKYIAKIAGECMSTIPLQTSFGLVLN